MHLRCLHFFYQINTTNIHVKNLYNTLEIINTRIVGHCSSSLHSSQISLPTRRRITFPDKSKLVNKKGATGIIKCYYGKKGTRRKSVWWRWKDCPKKWRDGYDYIQVKLVAHIFKWHGFIGFEDRQVTCFYCLPN